jgi:alkylhydroperoxidase/carboxymuconolactone decarboxylase family protein YurZ
MAISERAQRNHDDLFSGHVSRLAVSDPEPQLKGHTAANLRVGNDRAVLLAVLTHVLPFVGYPRTLNALRVLDDVAPAADHS